MEFSTLSGQTVPSGETVKETIECVLCNRHEVEASVEEVKKHLTHFHKLRESGTVQKYLLEGIRLRKTELQRQKK